jgi:hypothetical protein
VQVGKAGQPTPSSALNGSLPCNTAQQAARRQMPKPLKQSLCQGAALVQAHTACAQVTNIRPLGESNAAQLALWCVWCLYATAQGTDKTSGSVWGFLVPQAPAVAADTRVAPKLHRLSTDLRTAPCTCCSCMCVEPDMHRCLAMRWSLKPRGRVGADGPNETHQTAYAVHYLN